MLESAIGLYPQTILDDGIERTLTAARGGHKSRGVPRSQRAIAPRRPPATSRSRRAFSPRPAPPGRAARAAPAPLRRRGRRARRRGRLHIRSRRLSPLLAFERAQTRDVLEVLIVGLGERMSPGAVGHKKQFLCARGIRRGLD